MPIGPNGEKRPADAVTRAFMIARIAAGEASDNDRSATSAAAATLGRRGGKARAAKLSADERNAIAKKAAAVRYGKG